MASASLKLNDRKDRFPNGTELPPCRVCGDKASGFHYGVNTCEACKGFFRRCLKRGDQEYKCRGNIKCNIENFTINAKCPKCRLDKCLSVGMSKSSIQMGRYTLDKRTDYIVEINKEKALFNRRESGSTECTGDLRECLSPNDSFLDNRKNDLSKCPNSNALEYKSFDLERMQHIIHPLLSVYPKVTYATPEFLDAKTELEDRFLDKCHLEEQLYGKMQVLSIEEYADVKSKTGIDIDDRQEIFAKGNEYAETYAIKSSTFMKSILGFNDLCKDDKLSLLKNAMKLGVPELLSLERFNMDRMLYHSSCGTIFTLETFKKISSDDSMIEWFLSFKKLQELTLHKEELLLAVAVFSLSADQLVLREPEKVELILNKHLDCLLYLIEKNHPREKFVFPKLVSFFVENRTIQHSCSKDFWDSLEEKLGVQIHQVVHEMNQ